MKKTVIALAIVFVSTIIFYIYNGCALSYILNWNFYIPASALYKHTYHKQTPSNFHGDGIKYNVFEYQNDYPLNSLYKWSENESSTEYYSSFRETSEELLKEVSVDEKYYPDYSQCTYFYLHDDDNSEMIVFRNCDKKTLYILENII